jgi:hypothetical protein
VLSAATARAGEHLGLTPLGRLVEDAPADLIGVRGKPIEQFKLLEYLDLVVSEGATIVESVALIGGVSAGDLHPGRSWRLGRRLGTATLLCRSHGQL